MFWYALLYARTGTRVALALALVAFGIGLEFLQALTPTRHFSYLDMRDDAIGVAAGWLFAAATARWLPTARIPR